MPTFDAICVDCRKTRQQRHIRRTSKPISSITGRRHRNFFAGNCAVEGDGEEDASVEIKTKKSLWAYSRASALANWRI